MKGVFDTKSNPGYDDDITRRYHFPTQRNYLEAARALVGDWIQRAYIAVARVLRIDPDPTLPKHAYARVVDYLAFDSPVPFAGDGEYWEAPLRAIGEPSRVGAQLQGRAIRLLDDADFAAIVRAGLSETLAPYNAARLGLGVQDVDQAEFQFPDSPPADQVRQIEQILVNRKIRDANFRHHVCDAYEDRCAVTGLRIINGGGRSEVQAAHIWGVGQGGPDVVQNGLALSGTAHWLFDRHLISLTGEYRLLVSHNNVPAELRDLFEKQMNRIHLPSDARLWPHQAYVARHRDAFMAA